MKDKKKGQSVPKPSKPVFSGAREATASTSHEGGMMRPNGESAGSTVAFDKFAFTDEDEDAAEKKQSSHRSTERARRGKISKGIQRLWSLIPPENKGTSTKETLVGILDKVAVYIQETQQKLDACFHGDTRSVRDAEVEMLQQKVAKLTEENLRYTEALKTGGAPDILADWKMKGRLAFSSSDNLDSSTDNPVVTTETKDGKKRSKGNTVREHLKLGGSGSNDLSTGSVLLASPGLNNPALISANGLFKPVTAEGTTQPIASGISQVSGLVMPPGVTSSPTPVDGKIVIMDNNGKPVTVNQPRVGAVGTGGSQVITSAPYVMPPMVQTPAQNSSPLVNLPLASNQTQNTASLNVPGVGQVQGNLVFQNGQLILMNSDLTSAAMAAAGITGNVLNTTSSDSPVLQTDDTPAGEANNAPPNVSSPAPSVSKPDPPSEPIDPPRDVMTKSTTVDATTLPVSSPAVAPSVPTTTNIISSPQVGPVMAPGLTTTLPTQTLLSQGLPAQVSIASMNSPITSVSTSGLASLPAQSPLLLPGQNTAIPMFPPQQPQMGMTYMTPQGQIVSLPPVQPNITTQGSTANILPTISASQALPNNLPSALLLPNGQVVPVVTQPSLLFSQQSSTLPQMSAGTNTIITKPQPPGIQPLSMTPALGGGLLMTSNANTSTTTIPSTKAPTLGNLTSVQTTNSIHINTVSSQAWTTSGVINPPVTSVSTSQAVTNATTVTYSHTQPTSTAAPASSGPTSTSVNILPGNVSSQVLLKPNPDTTGVHAFGGTSTAPPNAIINKAGQVTLQGAQAAITPSTVSGATSGTLNTAVTGQTCKTTTTSGASGIPPLPSTMTAVVSADGSIVLTLPQGPQASSFMLDPNTIPSLLPGLSGTQAPAMQAGVKKNKKGGQRALRPKPPDGGVSLQPTMTTIAPQKWLTTVTAPSNPPPTQDKTVKEASQPPPTSENNKVTSPLTIVTTEASKEPTKSDILAQAAESIFSTSIADISPPISSFYNPANEDNALQIDTSAAETQSDNEVTSKEVAKKPQTCESPKKPSGSSKKSKSKKKVDDSVSSGKSSKTNHEKKAKSSHSTPSISVPVKTPVVPGQSPIQGTGDDNDEMVIDLQNESLQSPPRKPMQCEQPKQSPSEVNKSQISNLNMPKDFGSPEPIQEKNALTPKSKDLKTEDVSDLLADVLESSMVASGITPTDASTDENLSPQCSAVPFMLPQFSMPTSANKTESKKKSKEKDSKCSKSSKSKSKHKKQKTSTPERLDACTKAVYMDLSRSSDSDTVVSKKENVNPTIDVMSATVGSVNLTPPSPVTAKSKKKSSKKNKAVDPAELLPDTITFSESDLADVLDQVESLGAKLNTSPKKSSNKRKKSLSEEGESPTKRKKGKGKDILSPEHENSNSMSADLLERAMKDIGPLDMDLSEPESLSDQPMFSRFLGNADGKSKDLSKSPASPQLVVNTNTSDDEVANTDNAPDTDGDKLMEMDTEKLDSPPRAPSLSPVPQKLGVPSPALPSSPDRSLLDSISSIVATSSETLTHSNTSSLSTQASTTATTTDTYAHNPVSTPLLTPVSSPSSRLQGPASPMFNSSSEIETKPAARHINLVSLAQSLAPPTPKHSIGHKQIATSSSVSKSQIASSSVLSSSSNSSSSSLTAHTASPTPPVPPLSHRPHTMTNSNLFTPPNTPTGSDTHQAPHINSNVGKKSSKACKAEPMLLNNSPPKGKPEIMESQLTVDLGEKQSTNLQVPERPPSSPHPISGLSIPSSSNTLLPMTANIPSSNLNLMSQHSNRVPSVGKQQPPLSLSQDSKPITPSPSPASSYTSPAHSNYSAEMLFSPSSVSSLSKSVNDNMMPQTQRPPSCQSQGSGQTLPPTSSVISSKSSSGRSQSQPEQQPPPQQQTQPAQSLHESNGSLNSRSLSGHQQPIQQIPRNNFYSAENMVSKSGTSSATGHSISKTTSSCRQSPAHSQDAFSVPMLGQGPPNMRPADVGPRVPPPNPNFLTPFSLAPPPQSSSATFSFSLSSPRNSTPTTSGRSQYETPPTFYGIPGMAHPHQGQGLGGAPPPGAGQLSMFMPPGPPNPNHAHSMGNLPHSNPRHTHRQATPQAITTQASNSSTAADVSPAHQRSRHYPNYPQENTSRTQGMHGGRDMGQYQTTPMMPASHESSNKNTSQQQPRNNSNNTNSMPPAPSLHSSGHNMGGGGSSVPPPPPNSRGGRNDPPYFAPGFPPLPGQAGNTSSASANQTPHLHHPPRPGTGPSPGPHRSSFDPSNPQSQRYPAMPAQSFNGHSFEAAHMQFQSRGVTPASSGGGSSQGNVGASFPQQGGMDNTQMQKSNSGQTRASVPSSSQHGQQQQQSQRPSNKNMSSSSSSSNSSKNSSKSSSSKSKKKSSAAHRCEVDTNLSNSIFETGRSMTPLFPMATMSPPTTRPLQSDGPTYLPTNLFSNGPRPLGATNPLQHKNADINPPFGQLFQRARPQNGLGLNFQPGFGMNSVHSSPHVSAGPAQMITPHSNSGSVVSHMTNSGSVVSHMTNYLNLFPDVSNGPGGPTGGQGPDSLNMSPIKFASAHGNILGPPSGPPGGGLENPGLQPHPAGGAQIYHQHRGPHQMAAPNMLHNAMTINSLLSHNPHSFDPRQVAPPINGSMGPPFGSHPHHPSFSMPLNF